MMVLVCLAERAGQMVSKDRLIECAWPDTAVSDDVLTRAISELRRLFDDDARQPRVIETIPKSGYRLIATVARGPLQSETPTPAENSLPALHAHEPTTSRRRGRLLVAAAALIVALGTGVLWQYRKSQAMAAPTRVVPITALSGSEDGASFSPDGRQIAFAWNGENPSGEVRPGWAGNWDIYVQLVGSSEVRQLTSDPAVDDNPVWSPNGRLIAYTRFEPASRLRRLRVMSSLGGSDRKVSDFAIRSPAVWTPDGRYLVAGRGGPPDPAYATDGIYLIPVAGGDARAITHPAPPAVDKSPAFSPDGHRLAFASCGEDAWSCSVQVVSVNEEFTAIDTPAAADVFVPRVAKQTRLDRRREVDRLRCGRESAHIPVARRRGRWTAAGTNRGGRRRREPSVHLTRGGSARLHSHVSRRGHLSRGRGRHRCASGPVVRGRRQPADFRRRPADCLQLDAIRRCHGGVGRQRRRRKAVAADPRARPVPGRTIVVTRWPARRVPVGGRRRTLTSGPSTATEDHRCRSPTTRATR